MQLHHIIPEAEGGPDTMENCIPLCLNCHEEVGSYNPRHPIGRKVGNEELRLHRDIWFAFVQNHPERLGDSDERLFRSDVAIGFVEPHYHEVEVYDVAKGIETKEVFAAKVRNQGTVPFVVEEIGFTCGDRKWKGTFIPYSRKEIEDAIEIGPGRSQIFSFFGVKIEDSDIARIDGMYLLTGAGACFTNKSSPLSRLIDQFLNEEKENGV